MHAREHEPLILLEIDVRIHEHAICPLFQKNLQTIQIDGRVARLGRFGYVHSQRWASTTRNHEYPYSVSCYPLLFNDFFELVYRAVCQTNHYFLLAVILSQPCLRVSNIVIIIYYQPRMMCATFFSFPKSMLFPFKTICLVRCLLFQEYSCLHFIYQILDFPLDLVPCTPEILHNLCPGPNG